MSLSRILILQLISFFLGVLSAVAVVQIIPGELSFSQGVIMGSLGYLVWFVTLSLAILRRKQ